jgi:hypothetical protein
VYDDVYGDHDEVYDYGLHNYVDDDDASGLRRHVPDVHAVHDARILDEPQDVRNVRRLLHELRGNVRTDGQDGRNDDALRGDVPPVCGLLQEHVEAVDGCLTISLGLKHYRVRREVAPPHSSHSVYLSQRYDLRERRCCGSMSGISLRGNGQAAWRASVDDLKHPLNHAAARRADIPNLGA